MLRAKHAWRAWRIITGRTKAQNKIGNEEFSRFPTSGDIDLPYIPIWWEFYKPFGLIHVYYKKISPTDFLILINNVQRKKKDHDSIFN